MKESEAQRSEYDGNVRAIPPDEVAKAAAPRDFRLGQEARFLLVAVGGGAMRVVRSAARSGVAYLETVAINGDDRVMEAIDFQRRVRVDLPRDGGLEDGGHPLIAPLPHLRGELDRVFEGSTFVTVVGSLGGDAGTEVLPSVLDAAARHAPFLSVFLMKPFACEEERRARADQAQEALTSQGTFAERVARHDATLRVLDNENAFRLQGRAPFNQLDRNWGQLVAAHIREHFVGPAESALQEYRIGREAGHPLNAPLPPIPSGPVPPQPHGLGPMPSVMMPASAEAGAPVPPAASPLDVEILLEVTGDVPPEPRPPAA